jgi:hydrogenase expression/formation protein HypC
VVDILGVKRRADLSLLEDVEVGDFVLLHAGFGIEKLDPEAAEETFELHRQIAAIELEEEPTKEIN